MAEVMYAYDAGRLMELFVGCYVATDMADVAKYECGNESDNAWRVQGERHCEIWSSMRSCAVPQRA